MVAALAGLVLIGCTSVIPLRHVDGREATCGPYYYYGIFAFTATEREKGCISDYQRQGFERTPQ